MVQYPFNSFNPYQMQQSYPRTEIVKVNGRSGAEAYQMAANSSVLLLDEREPILWLKTTDGAGYPTITPYSITPHKEAEMSTDTYCLLDQRITKLEERLNESNIISKQSNTDDASDKSIKADHGNA